MPIQIVINGREITNPLVKFVIGLGTFLVAAIFAAFLIFVVLPLVGFVVTLSLGLVGVIFLALVIAIPLIVGGAILGAILSLLMSPFSL